MSVEDTKKMLEANPDLVCKDINLLQPDVREVFLELQAIYPNVVPVETWRSQARRKQLIAKGKSWVKGKSKHEVGEAIDFCHRTRAYVVPESFWTDVQKKWKELWAKRGFTKVAYLPNDSGHLSKNQGDWI